MRHCLTTFFPLWKAFMIKADQLSPSCDIDTGENLNVFHYIPKWNKAHFYSVYLCNGINKWNYTSNYKSG